MKKIGKRYILLSVIIALAAILVWRVSTSYASMNIGYSGKNIVSGDKWGINITEITNIETEGNAKILGDIDTIGTTLNFDSVLYNKGDKISFDIVVTNTSNLNGELYALTLTGLDELSSEVIDYVIMPIDDSIIHEDNINGSIIKSGEKQLFRITLTYSDNVSEFNNQEYHLNLGSTIIYKQK